MEMLIAVAIIGILAAIALPVFSRTMEKTKATACAANRRTAKGMIMQAVMFNDGAAKSLEMNQVYTWQEVNQVLASAGYSLKENLCPSVGTITLDKRNNTYIVVCDVHGEGEAAGMKEAMDILKKATESFDSKNYKQNLDYNFVYEYVEQAGGIDKLSVPDKKEILKMMNGTAESFTNENLVWVGMQVQFIEAGETQGKAHNILVVTSKNEVKTRGNGNPGLKGYMFYYNGKYYRQTKLNKGKYDTGNFYSHSWGSNANFKDCLKNGGWEEVTNP